jgi:ribosomal protein S6-L-glutamate ligase RimK-like protein
VASLILILCTNNHEAIGDIVSELNKRGEAFMLATPGNIPSNSLCTIAFSGNESPTFMISNESQSFSSSDITGVWDWHPQDPKLDLPTMKKTMLDFCNKEWKWFVQGLWRILPEHLWVNHPKWSMEAEIKPYQLQVAKSIGFEIPDTIISNDPSKISELYNRHNGKIIYKTIRTQFWYNRKNEAFPIYTSPFSDRYFEDLDSLALNPAIYQENIDKKYDLRITVVGDKVFPAEIHSQLSEISKQDFRCYDISKTPYKKHELPDDIRIKCLNLIRKLHLQYGAIDMILTPDNRYIFLEINPSGQYGWVQHLTGMNISSAICDMLTGKHRRS